MSETSTEKEIGEEYKMWKKNAPFLYDLIILNNLEWPSLTVQWLPGKTMGPNNDYYEMSLLLGTHTSNTDQDYLLTARVRIPINDAIEENHSVNPSKIDIIQKIPHTGEINKARYMPQNPSIVATKTVSGNIHVFDRNIFSKNSSTKDPQIVCVGHSLEGYPLDWNVNESGLLLSGSDDGRICFWNIEQSTKNKRNEIEPIQTIMYGETVVDDVEWNVHDQTTFGVVGDDRRITIWDIREDTKNPSLERKEAHKDNINGISFNPDKDYLFATVSSDKVVSLWDKRNLKYNIHEVNDHLGEIYCLEWSPHRAGILATSGVDRRVFVWDFSKIGEEQGYEDEEDGSPELKFIHGGHTHRISDISWCKDAPWVMASVSENNILQIWQMASTLQDEEDVDEEINPKLLE